MEQHFSATYDLWATSSAASMNHIYLLFQFQSNNEEIFFSILYSVIIFLSCCTAGIELKRARVTCDPIDSHSWHGIKCEETQGDNDDNGEDGEPR